MKIALEDKLAYIKFLEERMHGMEILIHELEKIKQNYRLVNASLNENILEYRTQFKAVVACSENLLSERELMTKELSEKESKIKQLSIFPQSPKTVVYLSQILHILKVSEDSVRDDSDSIFSYVPAIKRIVDTMKKELWNDESEIPMTDLNDSIVQTEYYLVDSETQHEFYLFVEHKFVEADLPGELFSECQRLKVEIEKLKEAIRNLEAISSKKDEMHKELEEQLIASSEELVSRDKAMIEKEKLLQFNEKNLLILHNELEYDQQLLVKVLAAIEGEQMTQEAMSDQIIDYLSSTLDQYWLDSEMLETSIVEMEERVEVMENRWNEEIQRQSQIDRDYIAMMKVDMKKLHEQYEKQQQIISEKTEEITYLKKKIAEKSMNFRMLQDKLIKAERIFEKINNVDYSLRDNCLEENTSEPDLIAVETSDLIIHHGQMIENKLNKGNNLEEQLVRQFRNNRYLKNRLKRKHAKNKNLRKLIKKLKNGVHKLQLLRSKREYKIRNTDKNFDPWKISYDKLNDERTSLCNMLRDKTEQVQRLTIQLQYKDADYSSLEYEKNKMEKVMLNVIKDMESSIAFLSKPNKSIGTLTDGDTENNQISELKNQNKELSCMVLELQSRLDSLLNIPEKENSANGIRTSCVSVQASLTDGKVKALEAHYTALVDKLEKELSVEKARASNVEKLRKSYETRLSRVSAEHKKTVGKLKEEIAKKKSESDANYSKQLKLLNKKIDNMNQEKAAFEKQKEYFETQLSERNSKLEKQKTYYEDLLKKKFEEINNLKENYEKLLAHKDEVMNSEVNELKIEIENIITTKEEILNKTKALSLSHVHNVKKKFMNINRKLRNEKSLLNREIEDLKAIIRRTRIEKEDEWSQTDTRMSGSDINIESSKEFVNVESQTAFFYTHQKMVDVTVQTSQANNSSELKMVSVEQENNEVVKNDGDDNDSASIPISGMCS